MRSWRFLTHEQFLAEVRLPGIMNVLWSKRFARDVALRVDYFIGSIPWRRRRFANGLSRGKSLSEFPHRGRNWRARAPRRTPCAGPAYFVSYRIPVRASSSCPCFHTRVTGPGRALREAADGATSASVLPARLGSLRVYMAVRGRSGSLSCAPGFPSACGQCGESLIRTVDDSGPRASCGPARLFPGRQVTWWFLLTHDGP